MTKFRIYTGPTIVKQVADQLRSFGLNVYCVGTEHVFVECDWTRGECNTQLPSWLAKGFNPYTMLDGPYTSL